MRNPTRTFALSILALILIPQAVMSQYSYRYFEQTISLVPETRRVAVLTDGSPSDLARLEDLRDTEHLEVLPKPGWVIVTLRDAHTAVQMEGVIQEFLGLNFAFVSPVLHTQEGGTMIITPEAIVRFDSIVSEVSIAGALEEAGFTTVSEDNWAGISRARLVRTDMRNGFDVLRTVNRLADRSDVVYAEPDFIGFGKACGGPPVNDPGYPALWGFDNAPPNTTTSPISLTVSGTSDLDMNIPEAWQLTRGSSNVVVAVIDTGIELTHPDLATNIAGGFDTTSSGSTTGAPVNLAVDQHGTAVAGCIVAEDDNGIGIVGVAPDAKVLSARAHDGLSPSPAFSYSPSSVAMALDLIANMGVRITCNANTYGVPAASITTKYAETHDAGIIHFASSGNGSSTAVQYPALLPSVIAVGGVTPNGVSYGDHGMDLDLVAPATLLLTTDLTGANGSNTTADYATNNGTSFSCAYAAGIAALMISDTPELLRAQVQTALLASAKRNIANSSVSLADPQTFGHGLVDAFAALRAARDIAPPPVLLELLGQQADSRFGRSVALLRDLSGGGPPYVAVGAPQFDGPNGMASGRVYIYDTATGMEVTHYDGDGPGDFFGFSLAAVPSSSSGYENLLVGAPRLNHPSMLPGYAKLVDLTQVACTIQGGSNMAPGDNFGYSVAAVGALAPNTFEVVVGAPSIDAANQNGYIRVFAICNGSGILPSGTLGAYGPNEQFGFAVAGGDLDADGIPDILAGAPFHGVNSNPPGAGGGIEAFGGNASLSLPSLGGSSSPNAGDNFGYSLAILNNLDLNGSQCIAIGIPGLTQTVPGRVCFNTGPPSFAQISDITGGVGDEYGTAMAVVGDITGDMRPELAVGAPRNFGAAGEVRIESIAPIDAAGTLGAVTLLSIPGVSAGADAGRSLASGVDVDGDGINDLAVGSPQENTSGPNAGAVRIYRLPALSQPVGPAGQGTGDGFCSLTIDGLNGGPTRTVPVDVGKPFTLYYTEPGASGRVLLGRFGVVPSFSETYVLPPFIGGSMVFDPVDPSIVCLYNTFFATPSCPTVSPVGDLVASVAGGTTTFPFQLTMQGIAYKPTTGGYVISNAVSLKVQTP